MPFLVAISVGLRKIYPVTNVGLRLGFGGVEVVAFSNKIAKMKMPNKIFQKGGDVMLKTELQVIAKNEPVMKDIVPLANINLIEILYSSILTIAEKEKSKSTED